MDDSNTNLKIDEDAFMGLFVASEPALRSMAKCLLQEWGRVDEALQEASVTMWQKRGQLQEVEGFLPWAKVIVRFKCLQMIDELRRRGPVLSERTLELLADEAEAVDADLHLARQSALRQCLNQFSSSHREVLLAVHDREQSLVRLAESRGKSANAMYKLVKRLRDKLVECVRNRLQMESG